MEVKDFINILFSKNKIYILRVCDVILWGSILFVTFSDWFNSLILIPVSDVNQILKFIVSGTYIVYVEWLIVLILSYYFIKLFLINYIFNHQLVEKLFVKIIPKEFGVAFQSLKFRGKSTKSIHLARGKRYILTFSEKSNKKFLASSDKLIGVLLKIVILGILNIEKVDGLAWLSWLSIILSFITIAVIEVAIIKAKGKNEFALLIKNIGN